jgi:hypothetical protein
MGESDTLLNAAVGAVVALVTSFLPFSTVLGGAVAGYLKRGDRRAGAAVGALSGLLYMVPLALFGVLLLLVLSVPAVAERAGFALLFLVPVVGFLLVYTVGLGALGGVIGVYVRDETDIGGPPRRGSPGHPSEWPERRRDAGSDEWADERTRDRPDARSDERSADHRHRPDRGDEGGDGSGVGRASETGREENQYRE